jgi:hypothetical protein
MPPQKILIDGKEENANRVLIHNHTGERRNYNLYDLTSWIYYDADWNTGQWTDEEDLPEYKAQQASK